MFMSWLDLCLSRHNLLILHFISVFTQMGYVYWDKKEKNRREDGSLSLIICTDLPLSLVHIITQCAATFTVRGISRFSVILHLLAGITSRLCKEPPSGACYQSCMFSLHLPSLPPWLVDKFFGCTCFHGLIVSTDLQQYLC